MNIIHYNAISLDDIRAGDILLCCARDKDRLSQNISDITGSHYTHAAICIGDGKSAHAGRRGIEINPLEKLVHRGVQTIIGVVPTKKAVARLVR